MIMLGIAEQHSRMFQLALVKGDKQCAHELVGRAFDSQAEVDKMLGKSSPVDRLCESQVAVVLCRFGVCTAGDLLALTPVKLAKVPELNSGNCAEGGFSG